VGGAAARGRRGRHRRRCRRRHRHAPHPDSRAELTTRHRLREGLRIFRIVALRDQDGTRRFTEIAAEERVD
jgi:head-tail adaptor